MSRAHDKGTNSLNDVTIFTFKFPHIDIAVETGGGNDVQLWYIGNTVDHVGMSLESLDFPNIAFRIELNVCLEWNKTLSNFVFAQLFKGIAGWI